MNLLKRILNKGCSHRFSWPRVESDGRHYQICLQCGTSYEYDWSLMHRTNRLMASDVRLHIILARESARPVKSL
jgi:hypothetical protein